MIRSPLPAARFLLSSSMILTGALGCSRGGDSAGKAEGGPPAGSAATGVIFRDVTTQAGVDFVHFNGMSGEYYIPEVTGAGVGVLDFDNDGDLDLYLPQGTMLGPGKTPEQAFTPPAPGRALVDRLYRNELQDAAGDGSRARLLFVDVTEASGLDSDGYGMGVASGDYDNDGYVDLYVTNLASNRLYHNNGDGTFSDVTLTAGADDERWSVPALFFDYDRDGWLDLFIGNYLDFTYQNHRLCMTMTGERDYCAPSAYRGVPDRLLHNEGDGTFTDATRAAGLDVAYGPALGAISADFDDDGWPDLYVANDGQPNQMWVNRGDGTFEDRALMGGSAVNGMGFAEASMGVDAADFDGDGDEDLFMAHISGETNTIYRNDGAASFDDASIATGLGTPSKWATGFGAGSLDYDNDGWLDVLVVNGAVRKIEEQARAGVPYPLRQHNQLYHNAGGGRFVDVTATAGPAFEVEEVSRGTAFADLDNDGDTDALILNSNAPAQLLLNEVGQSQHWLGLRLIGPPGPAGPAGNGATRDMLGARVELVRPDGTLLRRRVRTSASFASANDPRVLFGLGTSTRIDTVRVRWPEGSWEEFGDLAVDAYSTLRRGTGRQVD